jgi:polyamine oxidase
MNFKKSKGSHISFSRRNFLSSSMIAGMGLLINPKTFAQPTNSHEEIADCLVLGAGMAGISAAKNLAFPEYSRKGYKVIVLESSSYVGGRILSIDDPTFGGPVEMGAEYIHRKPGSVILWDDVKKYKAETIKVPRMLHGRMYYDGWGDNLRKHIAMAKEWNLMDITSFSSKANKYKGPNISAKQWIEKQGYEGLGRNLVDLYFTGHIPGHLDEVSVRGFAADRVSEQEMEWNEYQIVGGYSSFVEKMTYGINQHQGKQLDIRFNSPVNQIKYTDQGVEVRVKGGKIYKAKTAIITFSVGVLKSGKVEFIPALPEAKQEALKCLGMGDEVKVALKFKKRFWPEDTAIINSVASENKMCRTFFIPFYGDDKNNNSLTALFAGEEADRVTSMSDDTLIRGLCADLDKMFPHAAPVYEKILTPSSYLKMQWSQSPHTMGSDSFLKANVDSSIPIENVRKTLARCQDTPCLYWAGEATASGNGTQAASTHGAHFSGARAAIEVFTHLETKKHSI